MNNIIIIDQCYKKFCNPFDTYVARQIRWFLPNRGKEQQAVRVKHCDTGVKHCDAGVKHCDAGAYRYR